MAIVSDAFKLRTKRFTISASFLSLVLAMTLLGPAPAALLGVVSMGLQRRASGAPARATRWSTPRRTRSSRSSAASRSRLIGGPGLLESSAAIYILAVFALFLAMNVLNFLLIAIDVAVVDGGSIADRASGPSTSRCCRSSSRPAC